MRDFDALPSGVERMREKRNGRCVLSEAPPMFGRRSRSRLVGTANVQVTLHRVRGGHEALACIPDKVKLRRSCLPQVQSRRRVPARAQHAAQHGIHRRPYRCGQHRYRGCHKVILGAVRTIQAFAFACAVANDCCAVSWSVLQLDRVVVESGLLVVETNVAVLVELARSNYRLNLHCAGAVRLQLGSTPPISTVAVIEPPPAPFVSTVIERVP